MSFILFLIPSTMLYISIFCLIVSMDSYITGLGRILSAYASITLMSLTVITFRGIWKALYDEQEEDV